MENQTNGREIGCEWDNTVIIDQWLEDDQLPTSHHQSTNLTQDKWTQANDLMKHEYGKQYSTFGQNSVKNTVNDKGKRRERKREYDKMYRKKKKERFVYLEKENEKLKEKLKQNEKYFSNEMRCKQFALLKRLNFLEERLKDKKCILCKINM